MVWCCSNFDMLIQKYHCYFLIFAVQLLTYYFPVCQLLISHKFTTFPWSHDHGKVMWPHKSVIILTFCTHLSSFLQHDPELWSCTCHIIEAFQSGKGSGASQLSVPECARVYPCLTSVGVAHHLFIYCVGKLCIPAINDSEGEGSIHIWYFVSLACLYLCIPHATLLSVQLKFYT